MKKISSVILLSLLLFSCNNEKINNNEEISYYDIREVAIPYDSIFYLKNDMKPLNGFVSAKYNNIYFVELGNSLKVKKLTTKERLNYNLLPNYISYVGNNESIIRFGNYIDGQKDGYFKEYYYKEFRKLYNTALHYEKIDTSIYKYIMIPVPIDERLHMNIFDSIQFTSVNIVDSYLEELGLTDCNTSFSNEKRYFVMPKLRLEGNYINGVKDGMFTYYNKQGKITKKINWKNGEKDGLRRFYYDNIEKNKYEIHYNKKEKEGEYRYWYENDQLKVSGSYKNDKIHGKWKLFYKNGRTESEKLFKNGKLITEICYDKKSNKQINCNSSWLRKNVDERFDLKFSQKRKEYINNYVFGTLRFMEANSLVFDINKAKQKLDKYSIEYSEGFNGLAKLSNEGDSSIVWSYLTNENEYDIMKYNVKFEDSKERLISVYKNKTKELEDNTIQELIEYEISYIFRYYDVNNIDNIDELSEKSKKGILGEIIIKPEDW